MSDAGSVMPKIFIPKIKILFPEKFNQGKSLKIIHWATL
jgi:hypothetical protein